MLQLARNALVLLGLIAALLSVIFGVMTLIGRPSFIYLNMLCLAVWALTFVSVKLIENIINHRWLIQVNSGNNVSAIYPLLLGINPSFYHYLTHEEIAGTMIKHKAQKVKPGLPSWLKGSLADASTARLSSHFFSGLRAIIALTWEIPVSQSATTGLIEATRSKASWIWVFTSTFSNSSTWDTRLRSRCRLAKQLLCFRGRFARLPLIHHAIGTGLEPPCDYRYSAPGKDSCGQ